VAQAFIGGSAAERCVLDTVVEPGDRPRGGAIVGLHDENSAPGEILPLLRALSMGRTVIAPRSARWSRFGGGGRYSWFSSVHPPLIEPVGFGDSLIQLERLVLDWSSRDLGERGITIVGQGQGATMALALATLWPEILEGVVAIGGSLPVVPGWTAPVNPLESLRVLLVECPEGTSRSLARLGAQVSERRIHSEAELADVAGQWLWAECDHVRTRMKT
jgi:pimeloyl-ACP methyl ester carboxylesterase